MRTVAVIWLFFERNEAESFCPRSAHPAHPAKKEGIERGEDPGPEPRNLG